MEPYVAGCGRSERERAVGVSLLRLGALHTVPELHPRHPSGQRAGVPDAGQAVDGIDGVPTHSHGAGVASGGILPELPSPGGMIDQNTESIENSNTPQNQSR